MKGSSRDYSILSTSTRTKRYKFQDFHPDIMSEIIHYQIQQLIDNGQTVQLTLAEDVQTEPISQKQLMLDAINQKLDPELRDQITPFIEAILQAQPTIAIKSYSQTSITITMPKRRYEKMGSPSVGQRLEINIRKV